MTFFSFHPTGFGVRKSDPKYGSGAFGASRDGGKRKHMGVDLFALLGQEILAPFDALVVREALAYPGDVLKGVVLRGLGPWRDYDLKMLYMVPFPDLIGKHVAAGTPLGIAQSLQERYPGISDHIHFQLSRRNMFIDPSGFLTERRGKHGPEFVDSGVG